MSATFQSLKEYRTLFSLFTKKCKGKELERIEERLVIYKTIMSKIFIFLFYIQRSKYKKTRKRIDLFLEIYIEILLFRRQYNECANS